MFNQTKSCLFWQKKAKEFGKQKLAENVDAEAYIAEAGEKPKKKKSKHKHS